MDVSEFFAGLGLPIVEVWGMTETTGLATEWTADSEELTPTLKLKRRVIHAKYRAEIEALYT